MAWEVVIGPLEADGRSLTVVLEFPRAYVDWMWAT